MRSDPAVRIFLTLAILGLVVVACSGSEPGPSQSTLQSAADRFPAKPQSSGSFPTPTTGRTEDTFAVPEITSTTPATDPTTTTAAPTTTTTGLCVIEIQGDVLFDTDKWVLKDTAEAALSTLADQIRHEAESPELGIVGHTDSRGTEAHNLTLSERRAQAVYEWFVSAGFDPSRMTFEGRGESEPKVPDTDADGNFIPSAGVENRRVEIFVSSTQACP